MSQRKTWDQKIKTQEEILELAEHKGWEVEFEEFGEDMCGQPWDEMRARKGSWELRLTWTNLNLRLSRTLSYLESVETGEFLRVTSEWALTDLFASDSPRLLRRQQ